ncbi:hexokinase-like protein [Grosmannia clavigera kw1407]|uniref:Phosphotransferase n=1 Tax=Grosmannia clavigera (strain kw1407 / UAMH 11150) TaxID=655863 RepID=F0XLC9_GROCL|nr:hexokinase-like protein [Grosmannia clavigera kw1407]EFX01343.1 hexokinase-like protein [Grosmannia clavigera kw1407]
MTSLRGTLFAAIRSLVRGKSFLKVLLLRRTEETPAIQAPEDTAPTEVESPSASLSPSASTPLSTPLSSSPSSTPSSAATTIPISQQINTTRPVADFLSEAEELLLRPVESARLGLFSRQLKDQYRERLFASPACMLPSYNHQLPNGQEFGRYLCLDVGGSTLRVALIELHGQNRKELEEPESNILCIQTVKITPDVKRLEGMQFFDWVAFHIAETVSKVGGVKNAADEALPMGLAWSFPIEQTSLRGGLLQGMGKGFHAADSLEGQDLGDIIQTACTSYGLCVELAAIVNDSAAALLSEAYVRTSTRFSLILGTGVNMAVHLPVSMIGRPKFGSRPEAWFDSASHVIVNTELSMFGCGLLPTMRWDMLLKADHLRPDFQPLEQMVSGYYLGEICRFALIEATTTTGLFRGILPPSLLKPYSLDTETLSIIESDSSPSLEEATAIFHSRHPCIDGSAPTKADIATVRALASLVSQRSAAIVAAAVYAMWLLKIETEGELQHGLADSSEGMLARRHADAAKAELSIMHERTAVAFNGSVLERYPRYLEQCQGILNELLLGDAKAGEPAGVIEMVPAKESSLLGAAVSLACLKA